MARGKGKSIYGREYLEAPVTQNEVQPETEGSPLQDNSDSVAVPVASSAAVPVASSAAVPVASSEAPGATAVTAQPMPHWKWMLILLALIILLLLMGAYLVEN